MVGDCGDEVVTMVLEKENNDLQQFLVSFGVEDREAYTFCQNLVHKKFEAQVIQVRDAYLHSSSSWWWSLCVYNLLLLQHYTDDDPHDHDIQ